MAVDPELRAAFRPFERRAMLVLFVRAFSIGLLASLLFAEIAMSLDQPGAMGWAVLAIALITSVSYAIVRRPRTLALARTIDDRARLNDLLVTAIDARPSALQQMVRHAGLLALAKEQPARTHPIELPRHWRRWLVVAVVVQAVLLPLVFRSPARRLPQAGLTSLALPAATAGANAAAPRDPQQRPAAEPSDASAPSPASAPASARQSQQYERRSPAGADRAGASGSAAPIEPANRLRLAAAGASAEIASGRVPLARRAIVERYFATIQSQRKRPR